MCIAEHPKGWAVHLEQGAAIMVLKGFNVITIHAHPLTVETTREQCLIKAHPEAAPESYRLFVTTPNEKHVYIHVLINREAALWLAENCGIKNNLVNEVKP
ncbi:hypothetical protein [Aliidiomarina sanyensis]|uniref:Uncharacterized protein n=1 Tax=Aliidiomarina sanyensis TaxID=1249555 RepID=A0A432WCI8_9GAMM|nr:hypothetical protein [Aliidiomarina sanyensis]RUO28189.1 hypothetical protein CWE11_10800 [Aliidiomarina sanyensis]